MSPDLDLPLIDLIAIEKVICYQNQVIKVAEENLDLNIPILSPVEKTYEKGQITALLKSCYFIGNETRTQQFEDAENEEKVREERDESCQEPDLLYDLPKIPAVRNVNSSTSGLPSVPEGHLATAGNCENEPESTECSNLASNEFCLSLL